MVNRKITREEFFYGYREYLDTFVGLDKEFKKKFYPQQKKAFEKDSSLLSRFIDFKEGFQKEQEKLLEVYKSDISSKTGENWQVDPMRVLYIHWRKKEEEPRIGIECVFEKESYKYPHGIFHISVASWDKSTFEPYTKKLEDAFPNKHIDYTSTKNRAFLPIAAITPEGNQEVIVSILEKIYKTLKEKIFDKHEKSSK